MNIRKIMMATVIAGTTSLFATNLGDVSTLVDQINHTKDVLVKKELMVTLDKSIKTLDKKDYDKAQAIIKKDLKIMK
jgi:hypothetical protein